MMRLLMKDYEEEQKPRGPPGYDQISEYFDPSLRSLTITCKCSMCGICALVCRQLFTDKVNISYCKSLVTCLAKHLMLPPQVESMAEALLSGQGGDVNSFVDLIREKVSVQNVFVRVVKRLVLFALIEGWINRGVYDARLRIMIMTISQMLNVPYSLIEMYEESMVTKWFHETLAEYHEDLKKLKENRKRKAKKQSNYMMIGLAGFGGGILLGLTGGLAAIPLVAAGASAGATVAGIAMMGSYFNVTGTGISQFAFATLTNKRELRTTIAVAGWVTEEGKIGFKMPWSTLMNSGEQYCVLYENDYMLEFGLLFEYFENFTVALAAREALGYFLHCRHTSIAWPVIDIAWEYCLHRTVDIGRLMSDILQNTEYGRKPITLIGFGFGARVIFYCLLEMAKSSWWEGIIQDAIMLGAPVTSDYNLWKMFSRVVNGRIINGFCRNDWLLKFLCRNAYDLGNIAGMEPICLEDRRMVNVDLSRIVENHLDYGTKISSVLQAIGIRTSEDFPRMSEAMRPVNPAGISPMSTTSMPQIPRSPMSMSQIPLSPMSMSQIPLSTMSMSQIPLSPTSIPQMSAFTRDFPALPCQQEKVLYRRYSTSSLIEDRSIKMPMRSKSAEDLICRDAYSDETALMIDEFASLTLESSVKRRNSDVLLETVIAF